MKILRQLHIINIVFIVKYHFFSIVSLHFIVIIFVI